MRVRTGGIYKYEPVPMDRLMPAGSDSLQEGDVVRVIQLPGAPKPNTMNHAHVERVSDGRFGGLVHTNSLVRQ
jgi:hypothetical protein